MSDTTERLTAGELLNVFSSAQNAVAIFVTEDLVIEAASDRMISFWGKDRSITGMRLEDALPELKSQGFIDLLKEVWRTGISYEANEAPATVLVNGVAQTSYYDFRWEAIRRKDGLVYCILVTANDVTERVQNKKLRTQAKQQQAALEREQILNEELNALNKELNQTRQSLLQSKLLLENAVSAAGIGTFIIDLATNTMTSSASMKKIFGYRPGDDMPSQAATEGLTEDCREQVIRSLQTAITKGTPFFEEYTIARHHDKQVRWIRGAGKVDTSTIEGKAFFSGALIDITEQVESRKARQRLNEELASINEELSASNEELVHTQKSLHELNDRLEERVAARTKELQESEGRFRWLIARAPVAINVFETRDMVVTFANEKMLDIWHKQPGDLNRPFREILPELVGQPFLPILDKVFTTGDAYYGKENKALLMRNGQVSEEYFSLIYQPVKDAGGNVTSIIQVVTDVTEQMTARTKLEQARQLLETAIEAGGVGTYIIDRANQTLTASPRLKELYGYHFDEEMPYGAAVACITEEYRERVAKSVEAAFAEGKPFLEEYAVVGYHDNRLRWVRSVGKAETASADGNVYFSGAVVDITDQVEARKAEQRMNEELTAINEELLAANEELLQAQDNYIEATRQSEKNRDDLRFTIRTAGLGTFDLDLSTNRFAINDLLALWSGTPPGEDLSLEAAIGTVADYDRDRLQNAVLQASQFDGGGELDVEYTILNEANPVPRIVRARGRMFFTEDNVPVRLTGVVLDITEQKRDEQRKNEFIGMVSHEMKTPLTSLNGFLQLLQMRTGNEDAFANNMLGKANRQISKMTTLINGFLNVSRLESGKIQINKQRFDMAVLVKEAEEEAASMYNMHRVVFAPVEETFVIADKDKIGQVISNLISNAVKYSPSDTLINIACVTHDGNAVVSVTEAGIGIKPEDQPKLFDRYYRVNNDNTTSVSGFGIGLYLCAEIIQRHDGKLWVESEVGKGSAFLFSLPVVV